MEKILLVPHPKLRQHAEIISKVTQKEVDISKKMIELLEHRTKIDLLFKKRLVSITKGKIRFIEQLICYESYFV